MDFAARFLTLLKNGENMTCQLNELTRVWGLYYKTSSTLVKSDIAILTNEMLIFPKLLLMVQLPN